MGDGLVDGEEMAFCMHNGGGVGNVGSGIGGGTPDPIDIIIENLNNSSDDSCYKLECTVAY